MTGDATNDPVLEATQTVHDDIANQFDLGAGRITKALLLYEYIDDDGDRHFQIVSDRDSTSWDMRGMLHEAIANFDAFEVREQLNEESEGEF